MASNSPRFGIPSRFLALTSVLILAAIGVACGGSSKGALLSKTPGSNGQEVGTALGNNGTAVASPAAGPTTTVTPPAPTATRTGSDAPSSGPKQEPTRTPTGGGAQPGPVATPSPTTTPSSIPGNAMAGSTDLASAAANFAAVKSYRVSSVIVGGTPGWDIAVIRPDRIHYAYSGGPRGAYEFIVIGPTTYTRDQNNGNTWVKQNGPTPVPLFDLSQLTTVLQKAGANAASYTKSAPSGAVSCQNYTDAAGDEVCIANGLPVYIHDKATGIYMIFKDFNAVADIKAPI